MKLPGKPFQAGDSADLSQFLEDVCEKCIHLECCTILAHAGAYGGASEWREVDGRLVCIRQEQPAQERELTRNDAVGVTCLSLAGITVDEAIVAGWTDEQWWQAVDWSTAVYVEANDHDDIEVPPMPEFLVQYVEGTP